MLFRHRLIHRVTDLLPGGTNLQLFCARFQLLLVNPSSPKHQRHTISEHYIRAFSTTSSNTHHQVLYSFPCRNIMLIFLFSSFSCASIPSLHQFTSFSYRLQTPFHHRYSHISLLITSCTHRANNFLLQKMCWFDVAPSRMVCGHRGPDELLRMRWCCDTKPCGDYHLNYFGLTRKRDPCVDCILDRSWVLVNGRWRKFSILM